MNVKPLLCAKRNGHILHLILPTATCCANSGFPASYTDRSEKHTITSYMNGIHPQPISPFPTLKCSISSIASLLTSFQHPKTYQHNALDSKTIPSPGLDRKASVLERGIIVRGSKTRFTAGSKPTRRPRNSAHTAREAGW